jgi:hypothetical protein
VDDRSDSLFRLFYDRVAARERLAAEEAAAALQAREDQARRGAALEALQAKIRALQAKIVALMRDDAAATVRYLVDHAARPDKTQPPRMSLWVVSAWQTDVTQEIEMPWTEWRDTGGDAWPGTTSSLKTTAADITFQLLLIDETGSILEYQGTSHAPERGVKGARAIGQQTVTVTEIAPDQALVDSGWTVQRLKPPDEEALAPGERIDPELLAAESQPLVADWRESLAACVTRALAPPLRRPRRLLPRGIREFSDHT